MKRNLLVKSIYRLGSIPRKNSKKRRSLRLSAAQTKTIPMTKSRSEACHGKRDCAEGIRQGAVAIIKSAICKGNRASPGGCGDYADRSQSVEKSGNGSGCVGLGDTGNTTAWVRVG